MAEMQDPLLCHMTHTCDRCHQPTKCNLPVFACPWQNDDEDAMCQSCMDKTAVEMAACDPSKTREGDQPLPIKNNYPVIQDLVLADVEERKKVGLSRYGTYLQPHNGRDFLLDAYQEALDLAIYLRGVMYERDGH